MLEVVFVIVIIGILSAVALPRFNHLGYDAHLTKVERFVDTLNRSVAAHIWSGILRNVPQAKGSVKHPQTAAIPKYSVIFDEATSSYSRNDAQVVQIPTEITTNSDGTTGAGTTHEIPLTGCAAANTPIGVGVGRIASAKIGSKIYHIGCIDGSLNSALHFFVYDNTGVLTK